MKTPINNRIIGHPTRGKTAHNRLRRVDLFIAEYAPNHLRQRHHETQQSLYVDLGYGADPTTTLETQRHWQRLAPQLNMLGVEIDSERVATAKPFENDYLSFRQGGFNLPLQPGETVKLMRAMNVLRQYPEADVIAASQQLAPSMQEGGLFVEGTSTPTGAIWVANVLKRLPTTSAVPWQQQALVLSTHFKLPLDPLLFQAVLPKNLIHRMVPGEPIQQFFSDWKRCLDLTQPVSTWGRRQWFASAARLLRQHGHHVNVQRRWLNRGFLIWQPPVALFPDSCVAAIKHP